MSVETDVATTSVSSTGTPSSEDSTSVVSETPTQPETSEPERSAATVDSGEEDVKPEFDWNSVPVDLKPHVEKFSKEVDKGFKRSYTKKFQELSAKEKQFESERYRIQSELDQYRTVAADVLQHPEKLDLYRQMAGIQGQPQKPANQTVNIPPEVQTVGDLVNYIRNDAMQAATSVAQQRAGVEADARVRGAMAMQRWESAVNGLLATDPSIKEDMDIISRMADTPQYKQMYNGANEAQVLNQVYTDFKGRVRKYMTQGADVATNALKKKQSATTLSPKTKTVETAPNVGATRDEIIARVRARLGE